MNRYGVPVTAGVGAAIATELGEKLGFSGGWTTGLRARFRAQRGYCARTFSDLFASLGFGRPNVDAIDYPGWLKSHGARYVDPADLSPAQLAGMIIVYHPRHSLGHDTYGHVGVLVNKGGTLKVRSNITYGGRAGVQDVDARLYSGVEWGGNEPGNRPYWIFDVSGMRPSGAPGVRRSGARQGPPAPRGKSFK